MSWQKGVSGNPNGRPVDKARQEVLDIFKQAAPGLLTLAIKRAKKGDNMLLREFIKKALPDNIQVQGEISLSLKLAELKTQIDQRISHKSET